MRRLSIILALAITAAFGIYNQLLADPAQPKPEAVLRAMADYLGNLPAFACKIESALDFKAPGQEAENEVTKMTMRLERPNRLSLTLDEGHMGLTLISDGKQLVQYLTVLKRFAISEAPANYSEMTDVGVPIKPTILGSQGSLIPTPGDDFYKRITSGVESSKYLGTEKVGAATCQHLRFIEKRFDWDIWIEEGKRPVVHKLLVDLSKQGAEEKATIHFTVTFTDWNVAPKFGPSDFAFTPPKGAEEVATLIEPEPPHPLLGKRAPAFQTTDVDGKPFDLKTVLGKDVILLDFWSTSCGPCVMLMPELEGVAEKFKDRGLVYRAVNGGEDAESIKAFLAATKIKAPIVLDPELQIWRGYQVQPIPQTVLIGKDGKVQAVHLGYSPALAGEISKEVEDLLAGKDLAGEELAKFEKGRKKRPASTGAAVPANDEAKE